MSTVATISAEWFKPHERTYVAGFQSFAVNIGIAAGLVMSPAFLSMSGGNWRAAMALCSVVAVVGIILALITQFGPRPVISAPAAEEAENKKLFSPEFRKALVQTTFYVLLIAFFFDCWVQQAWLDLGTPYYAADKPLGLGLGPMGAGSRLAFASLAMMAGGLAAPVIVEKLFKGKPAPAIFLGYAVSALSLIWMRFLTPENGILLTLVPCLILFFSSFVNPTVVGYISKVYPHGITGRINGLIQGLGIFGAVVGVGIGAGLLSAFKSFFPGMTAMTTVVCVGAIVILFLKPPRGFNVEKVRHS